MRIAQTCTDMLLMHNKIKSERKAIYIYGFELLFSTVGCMAAILLMGTVFGYQNQAVTFLLYFAPIRIAAGGYHAKSYKECFLLTNGIAIGCIGTSKLLYRYQCLRMDLFLLLGLGIAIPVIWKNAPIITPKYKVRTNRYEINRRYAHVILIIEQVFLLLGWLLQKSCIVYTAIVTCYVVAIMMKTGRKGGV
ncbi:MAG: accessory gene regulator B family protein [Lachnospiraceae bacterium]|nr:accessory gene regulator B family protein [Lachnospiraceae bacterium]